MGLTKRQFEKVMRLAVEWHDVKQDFDLAVTKTYGYHYSDIDEDWIIDAIDYGGGSLSFDEFNNMMQKGKKVARERNVIDE